MERVRDGKKERCIKFLEMLPIPLFPTEVEISKIAYNVKCHRMTVFRARNELKKRYRLLMDVANISDEKYDMVKNLTLRSLLITQGTLLKNLYDIMTLKIMQGKTLDAIDKDRLSLIERYIGIDNKKGGGDK